MKVMVSIIGLLLTYLLGICQSKVENRAQQKDKATERQAWYSQLATKEMEKATGLVLNNCKYRTGGFEKLRNIPQEKINQLNIVKDSAEVRRYFADSTVRFVIVVTTK